MTDKIELKPCPFCGGKAQCIEFYGMYHVICSDCYIAGKDRPSIDGAVEAWNTRPIEDALRAENKRFRKALETICSIYEINGAEWRFDKRLYDVAKEALDNGSESRD